MGHFLVLVLLLLKMMTAPPIRILKAGDIFSANCMRMMMTTLMMAMRHNKEQPSEGSKKKEIVLYP